MIHLSYYSKCSKILFPFLNSIDQIIINCFAYFFDRYNEYNSCDILFSSFCEYILLLIELKKLVVY